MFREVLARAGSDLPGCRGAAVVGPDGLVVEQWTAGDDANMEPLAVEFTVVMKAARGAAMNSEGRALTEMTLKTPEWSSLVRAVGRDYFIIVLTTPDALIGRTRFIVERALPMLEKEFE